MTFANGLILRLYFSIITLFVVGELIAQSSGPFQKISWGTYQGWAQFEMDVVDNDSVLHGEFKMHGPIIEKYSPDKDAFYTICGQFFNNQPTGNWEYVHTQLLELKRAYLEDEINVKIQADVKKHKTWGAFDNRNANIEWQHLIYLQNGYQKADTIFTSKSSRNSDSTSRSIYLENPAFQLRGFTTNELFADSTWSWIEQPIRDSTVRVDSWTFDRGRLESITHNGIRYLVDDTSGIKSAELLTTFNFNAKYIRILRIKLLLSGILEHHIDQLKLLEQLDSVETERKLLISTLKGEFGSPLKFRLPLYSLNPEEQFQLEKLYGQKAVLDSLLYRIDSTVNSHNLLNHFAEVQSIMDTVHMIRKNDYFSIMKMQDLDEDEILPYINRDKLVGYMLEKYSFSSKTKLDASLSDHNLNILVEGGHHSVNRLLTYLDRLRKLVIQKQEQQALALREQKVIMRKELLDIALDSTTGHTNPMFSVAMDSIAGLSNRLYKSYNRKSGYLEKMIFSDKLLNCYDDMIQLIQTIDRVDQERSQIQKHYLDSTFNIHTATYVQFTVKRRILSSYNTILLPFFAKSIEEELSCENAKKLDSVLRHTHVRIKLLRNENTRELERSIKSETAPKELLYLFGITDAPNGISW